MSEKEFKVYNLSDVVPDATQLAQKNFFNFGDWVYIPAINEKGKVIGRHYDKHWEEDSLTLRMQDGRELKVLESNCKLSDYDPKTAFLHDLSELLRKYDANINFGFSVEERTCGVLFDIKDERIFYPFKVDEMEDTPDTIWRLPGSNYPLTPDNVLKYDK